MKKHLLLFFIICGLAKICKLPFQISPEVSSSSFCILCSDNNDTDEDEDRDSIYLQFPEISTEQFHIKPQRALVAYLNDIFWLGKNKYI